PRSRSSSARSTAARSGRRAYSRRTACSPAPVTRNVSPEYPPDSGTTSAPPTSSDSCTPIVTSVVQALRRAARRLPDSYRHSARRDAVVEFERGGADVLRDVEDHRAANLLAGLDLVPDRLVPKHHAHG